MIARTAIKEWLDRPLRRISRLKRLSPAEVNRRIAVMDPPPQFHTPPRHHQKVAFLAASQYDSLMLIFGLGLGKTYTSYMIIADKLACGAARRALVLVPTVSVCGVWADEARIHAPHLRVQILDAVGRQERVRQATSPDADVVVATYQGFLSLCSKTERSAHNPSKNRWVIGDHAKDIIKRFDILVCDESTAIKSYDSLYFRLCRKIADRCRFRYCLTGTPFNDPQDLWSQYYILDFGETLGSSLGLLREACFSGKRGYFGGVEWTLMKKHEEDIRRFLDNRTLRYEEHECLDLPPQIFQTIHVPPPPDIQRYYERIVREFREAQGDITVMQNVFVLMRQLTSGFMTGRDERDGRVFSDFDDNPKLDATEELIRELPAGKKMVIFHTYVHTGDLLEQLVRRIGGLQYERVWGQATRKTERIDRFRTDPNCRILVLNDQAGALGLNLQAANYVVFYECPVSPIVRQQAEKRCHRTGQTESVFYYDLVMRNTIDEKIIRHVRAGRDMMEELLRGRDELCLD